MSENKVQIENLEPDGSVAPVRQPWSYDMFSCLNDPIICIKGLFCPCLVFAENRHWLLGETFVGSCMGYLLCLPCSCFYHKAFRRRMRDVYGLEVGR